MLNKIFNKERNRYRSKLKIPGVNPGSGATGEQERDETLEPLQITGETSAVRRLTPSGDEEARIGNTETEALELTRIHLRNRRELAQISGTSEGEGSGTLAGWERLSTCWTASFLNPNRACGSGKLSHHASKAC